MRNILGTLCSFFRQKIDILLLSKTKFDVTFPVAQFCVKGYSTPYRLNRTCIGGVLLIYVRNNTSLSKLNKNLLKIKLSKDFLWKLLRKKDGFFAALIIQIKIKFCLTYML